MKSNLFENIYQLKKAEPICDYASEERNTELETALDRTPSLSLVFESIYLEPSPTVGIMDDYRADFEEPFSEWDVQ